jgi:ATP-dependent Clp protease ATP-binding subunit ClpC
MEVCCCSTSSPLLAGRRLAAPAASRYWGAAGAGRAVVLAHPLRPRPAAAHAHSPARRARRGGSVIRAVFERFTERAVKAVVLSQREAKGLGAAAVAPRHMLLGLVAEEDRSAAGFLSSGIGIERAREECRSIGAQDAAGESPPAPASGLDTDVPFSKGCKRVFEVAVELSRNMGCSFISPEHLAIALFTLDDPTTNSLLRR